MNWLNRIKEWWKAPRDNELSNLPYEIGVPIKAEPCSRCGKYESHDHCNVPYSTENIENLLTAPDNLAEPGKNASVLTLEGCLDVIRRRVTYADDARQGNALAISGVPAEGDPLEKVLEKGDLVVRIHKVEVILPQDFAAVSGVAPPSIDPPRGFSYGPPA